MKKQLMGTSSRYEAMCTQLCRDLKAKGIVLMVVGGREGNGMAVAASADNAFFGLPHVLGPFLRAMAEQVEQGAPGGIGVDTPDEPSEAS